MSLINAFMRHRGENMENAFPTRASAAHSREWRTTGASTRCKDVPQHNWWHNFLENFPTFHLVSSFGSDFSKKSTSMHTENDVTVASKENLRVFRGKSFATPDFVYRWRIGWEMSERLSTTKMNNMLSGSVLSYLSSMAFQLGFIFSRNGKIIFRAGEMREIILQKRRLRKYWKVMNECMKRFFHFPIQIFLENFPLLRKFSSAD